MDPRIRGGCRVIPILFIGLGVVGCGGNSSPIGPAPAGSATQIRCRSYPARYTSSSLTHSHLSTDIWNCGFARTGAALTCSDDYNAVVTTEYGSVADFVEEALITGRVLALSQTLRIGGTTYRTTRYSYDAGQRATQWTELDYAGPTLGDERTVVTANEWDEHGRPITASSVFYSPPGLGGQPVTCGLTISYDDGARTVTSSTSCSGTTSVSVKKETYDRTSFLIEVITFPASGGTRQTNQVNRTFSVCK